MDIISSCIYTFCLVSANTSVQQLVSLVQKMVSLRLFLQKEKSSKAKGIGILTIRPKWKPGMVLQGDSVITFVSFFLKTKRK